MTPASKIAAERARAEFVALVERGIEESDLGRAALLIAEEEEPRDDGQERASHYTGLLDAIGVRASERVAKVDGANLRARVEAFNEFLFTDEGFAGNAENYYDPRNSLLTHVLDRRTGIPITLSVVYIEVARRLGIAVEGVGLPGHFIVRVQHDEDDESLQGILVDPFNAKIIDADDCQERLDVIYGGQVALADEHLRRVTTRQILFRMLQNLKGIYTNANLDREAISVIERLMLLAPENHQERRDYGMLLARHGRTADAARELRRYLAASPNGEDAGAVGEVLKRINSQLARLN